MRKRHVPTAVAATLLTLGASLLWYAPAAVARMPYDGRWSVLIVTDAGTCDRAYRYGLDIADGRIFDPNRSFDVSGNVDPRGRVVVSVSAAGQRATGAGRLSGNYGYGQWSGHSSVSQCSGHWQAERRG